MKPYIVIDTETAPRVPSTDGKPHPETSLVYDLGYIVSDGKETIDSGSLAIADTFAKADIMQSAYYAGKLPQYFEGMRYDSSGEWIVVSWLDALRILQETIREYGVRDVWAYNARFDIVAINATTEYYSNGFKRYGLPYKTKLRDIWSYASNITGTRKYVQWCVDNGYVSAAGNPQTTAERVYAYLTGDNDYVERHTALEDAKIEDAILRAARRKHSKTEHAIGRGWQRAASVKRNM